MEMARSRVRKELAKMLSANVSKEIRKAIYRREGYECAVCGSTRQLEIHHVVKRSRGGSNEPMNLVCLCHLCHCAVHGERPRPRPLDEFPFEPEELEQAIVEYLADYYAETRRDVWWPWAVRPDAATRDRRRHCRWPFVFPDEHLEGGGL